jgi:hypothetical protein
MAVEAEMDAVFKSSRADKDPVSGNEVPTGSLPEEVRDDIPAQLSEGEYVVPADVVRYYGVKFFEDLRMEAKAGWNSMEENGRIGGEPVGMEMGDDQLPFDLAELQMTDDGEEQPEMYAGGYMRGYAPGGYQPSMDFGGKYGEQTVSVREYKNADGTTIYIQFIGETPLTTIPEGYEPAETAAEEVAEQLAEQTTSRDDDDTPQPDAPKGTNWKTAEVEDFNNYLSQKDSTINKVVKTGAALLGGAPMYGFMKMATKMEDKRMRKGLEEQIANLNDQDPTEAQKKKELQSILDGITTQTEENEKKSLVERSGIFGGEDTLLSDNLEDTDKSGDASFGDTWLGDLLGFDEPGLFKGLGVQGDSLSQSMSGSRRDGKPSSNDDDDFTPVIGDNDTGSNSLSQSLANVFTPFDGKSYEGGKLVDDEEEDK